MGRYKTLACIILLAAFILCYGVNAAVALENKWTKLVEKSGKVLSHVQQMPDEGIPSDLLRSCEAIAIFPNTVSVGLGLGGKYGQGIIIVRDKRNKNKWSCPALFSLAGGSIGWQIGGQATDVVLLIMSEKGVDAILDGKLKVGLDAAIAAGPVGRDAEAAIDMRAGGILSYSRSRGLFIGIKLEGVGITECWDGNKKLYGKDLSAEEILIGNKAKMPESAKPLLEVLNKFPYKK